jgi:hypothetical protein
MYHKCIYTVVCSNMYTLYGLPKFCYNATHTWMIFISMILHFPQFYIYFKVIPSKRGVSLKYEGAAF